ncbi:MAG: FkbM family methyltransferase [Candidatus Babeliales bacterium]
MNQQKPKQFSRELLKTLLPEDAIIIEAGAHIGRDTLKLSTLFPNGTIHAFEPVPYLFAELKKATENRKNIHCYNYALSNKTGTEIMFVSSEQCTALSSLLKPAEIAQEKPDISFIPTTVNTITLDDWTQKYNIDHVDFLWLDLQGHELTALQAAPNILKTAKALLIEVSLTERYKENPLYPQVKTWLEKQGFSVYIENLHHNTWGNVLFVKN